MFRCRPRFVLMFLFDCRSRCHIWWLCADFIRGGNSKRSVNWMPSYRQQTHLTLLDVTASGDVVLASATATAAGTGGVYIR